MGESDAPPPVPEGPTPACPVFLGWVSRKELSCLHLVGGGVLWQNAKMWAVAGETWGSQLLRLRSGTKPSQDALGASVFSSAG